MKIIVGLGNPGAQYELTRHNIGFWVLDRLAQKHRISLSEKSSTHVFGCGSFCKQKVFLAKPSTFMNVSGKAIQKIFNALNKDSKSLDDLLVVHDDVDLSLGRMKVKQGGGDGGHRGLISISSIMGENYIRFRLGVGRPMESREVTDYVLEPFSDEEIPIAEDACTLACQAIEDFLIHGLKRVQNRFNRKEQTSSEA